MAAASGGRPGPTRYKAFISYSHDDDRFARRLHRRIEGYRPRGDLKDASGRTPDRPRPVFLDREELAASSSLSEQIEEALGQSEWLVVICSATAATSRYVNEEIRLFAERRDPRRIVAIIAGGEPPDCFPPALLEAATEPIAADARAGRDGFDDGVLKVIAALLDAPYADLKSRDAIRRRRRTRLLAAVAAVFALISVAAVFSAWRAVEETRRANEELGRAEAAILVAVEGVGSIVERVSVGAKEGSVPTALADQLLNAAEGMIDGVVALAPDNRHLRREHGELLIQFARHHLWVGDTAAALAASDQAVTILDALAAETPDDTEALELSARAAIGRGDAALSKGRRRDAEADYATALATAEAATAADPSSSDAARARFDAESRIGAALRIGGDLDGALAAHERSLDVARDWANRAPDDLDWARAVTVALHSIGDIHVAMQHPLQALAVFEVALAVARDMTARRPDSAEITRSLAFALLRVGDTRRDAGNLASALDSYEESLTILRDVTALDPGNALWRRDLGVSLSRVGVARLELGDRDGAEDSYAEALAVYRSLLLQDPENARFARRVVLALGDLGDARKAGGAIEAALAAYEEARPMAISLAKSDPGNILALRDVASLFVRIGDAMSASASASEGSAAALPVYREGVAFLEEAESRDGVTETAELARERFLLLWRIALVDPGPAGEVWAKIVRALETVEAAGALTQGDARYLDQARRMLAEAGGG